MKKVLVAVAAAALLAVPATASVSSGGKLVFMTSSGGDIYTINADGSGLRLLTRGGLDPALSPDGATLVFISRRDADTVLVARTLATGQERVLARGLTHDDQEGFAALDLWPNYAFTPDGGSLIYSSKGKLHRLALTAGATPQTIPFTAPVSISLNARTSLA